MGDGGMCIGLRGLLTWAGFCFILLSAVFGIGVYDTLTYAYYELKQCMN